MNTLPMRLFGLVLTLLTLYGVYYNWQMLLTEYQYRPKLAFLAPFGVVGGLFIMIFPQWSGKPETKTEIIAVSIMCAVGIAAGLLNSYLMGGGFWR